MSRKVSRCTNRSDISPTIFNLTVFWQQFFQMMCFVRVSTHVAVPIIHLCVNGARLFQVCAVRTPLQRIAYNFFHLLTRSTAYWFWSYWVLFLKNINFWFFLVSPLHSRAHQASPISCHFIWWYKISTCFSSLFSKQSILVSKKICQIWCEFSCVAHVFQFQKKISWISCA